MRKLWPQLCAGFFAVVVLNVSAKIGTNHPKLLLWHLEKGGGTTVLALLKKSIRKSDLEIVREHEVFEPRHYGPDFFRVGLVREPGDYYISVYNWGVSGKGWLWRQLVGQGYGYLYEEPSQKRFAEWVRLVTKQPEGTRGCGLLSVRLWAALGDPNISTTINVQHGPDQGGACLPKDEQDKKERTKSMNTGKGCPCPLADCGKVMSARDHSQCRNGLQSHDIVFDCWIRTSHLIDDYTTCMERYMQTGGTLKHIDFTHMNTHIHQNKFKHAVSEEVHKDRKEAVDETLSLCNSMYDSATRAIVEDLEASYMRRFGFTDDCCSRHPGDTMPTGRIPHQAKPHHRWNDKAIEPKEVSGLTSNDSVALNVTPLPRIAVCSVGAVRSFVNETVYSSMETTFAGDHVDMFFHLFTGKELSRRGQSGFSRRDVPQLQTALKTATGVQLQNTENTYICDAISTGRFYKVQECAKMVEDYAALHHKTYDVLVITRPDIRYRAPQNEPVASILQKGCYLDTCWNPTESGEFEYGNYELGVKLAANLTQARCCEKPRELPDHSKDFDDSKIKKCFIGDSIRTNYLFHEHFMEQTLPGCRKKCHRSTIGKLPHHKIFRSLDQIEYLRREYQMGFSSKLLHNKIKPDVSTVDQPDMSRTIQWKTMTNAEQYEFIETNIQ